MKPISIELKRAVKCWHRTMQKWSLDTMFDDSFQVKLDRNYARVDRAARGYEENFMLEVNGEWVVLEWDNMHQGHRLIIVKHQDTVKEK